LTTNESQAVQFSEIVTKRQKIGAANVTVYEFDMKTAEKTLSILRFENADSAWLHFVTENRLKIYKGDTYDIVIGAVANDKVMPTLQAYWGGFVNEDAAIVTLKTSKLIDQVCLKSNKALLLLNFIKSYTTIKGVDVNE
jgi:hypothetical protein